MSDNDNYTLKNVSIYWPRLDPNNPVSGFDETKAKQWEVQIRTEDKRIAKEWNDIGISVKEVNPTIDEDFITYYRASLRSKATSRKGKDLPAPEVVDSQLKAVDTTTIGNGSVANINIKKYLTGMKMYPVGFALRGVQITKLVIFHSGPSFEVLDEPTIVESSGSNKEFKDDEDIAF